jgi:hypothetical protein
MGNYSQYKNVNTVFGGTYGITVPSGQQAERASVTTVGTLRYNTDLGLIEQYNALGWQSVDAPPTISSISGVINQNTTSTITVTGSNFKTGGVIYITGAAVSGVERAMSTTFINSSSVTFSTNATSVNFVGGAAFGLKLLNPSGLSGILDPAGTIDRDPVWSTAAGTYTVYDGARSTYLTFTAADPDGAGTITYSLASGSLPGGATLNASTGAIGPFNAVASDTSYPITLRATSTNGSNVQTTDLPGITIVIKAPVVSTFNSNGTFAVPSGVTAVDVLVVAGGGTGGNQHGGGGGAGGLIYRPAFPVTPGGTVSVTVGVGGTGSPSGPSMGAYPDGYGRDSNFGTLTAKGGGAGIGHIGGNSTPGTATGGSGGGGQSDPGNCPGAPGNQPAQPGDSGTYGFGNPGGLGLSGPSYPAWVGGGGGGAGSAGQGAPGNSAAGAGGVGRAYSISGSPVFYAGGGGGGMHSGNTSNNAGGNGGGGAGNPLTHGNGNPGSGGNGQGYAGTPNRGGGAGGSSAAGVNTCLPGGSGVVIVRY